MNNYGKMIKVIVLCVLVLGAIAIISQRMEIIEKSVARFLNKNYNHITPSSSNTTTVANQTPVDPRTDFTPHPIWIIPHPVKNWKERYQKPASSDLTVIPLADTSGLNAGWNYEYREYGARIIYALSYIAGERNLAPNPRSIYPVLDASERRIGSAKPFTPEDYMSFGKKINTKKFVRIETHKEGESIAASAEAFDIIAGKSIDKQSINQPERKYSYEELFNIIADISKGTISTLYANNNPEFLKNESENQVSPEAKKKADEYAEKAWKLVNIPSILNLSKALRFSIAALEQNPHSPEAWRAIALANARLSLALASSDNHIAQEMRLRSIVSGRIASWMAPDDSKTQFVYWMILNWYGRKKEALDLAENCLSKNPSDDYAKAMKAVLMQNRKFLPVDLKEIKKDQTINNLVNSSMISAVNDTDGLIKLCDEWSKEVPLSPNMCMTPAKIYLEKGELTLGRIYHAKMAVIGCFYGLCENVRQYEVAGKTKEADDLTSKICTMMSLKNAPLSASEMNEFYEEKTPLSEMLYCRFNEMLSNADDRFFGRYMNMGPGSFPYKLLEMMKKESDSFLENSNDEYDKNGLLKGFHALDLTSSEWLSLAQRNGIDGILESFYDVVARLYVPERGKEMGQFLVDLYPDDLPTLESICNFHRTVKFNNVVVDKFQYVMFQIDNAYLPAWQRAATFADPRTPEGRKKVEENLARLKYYAPFDMDNLQFITDKFHQSCNWQKTADYCKLIYARDPVKLSMMANGVYYEALAQNRLLTESEVEEIIAKIPEDHPGRNWTCAYLYKFSANIDKAIQFYEKTLNDKKNPDIDIYNDLEWLYRLKGDKEKSFAVLEKYLKIDNSSLQACSMLVVMAYIKLGYGDIEGAKLYLERANSVDDWKGDVIYLNGLMAYISGDYEEAKSEFSRKAERYEDADSAAELGFILLALGDKENAKKIAEEGMRQFPRSDRPAYLKAEIERISGNTKAGYAALNYVMRSMPHDPDTYMAYGKFFYHTGEFEKSASAYQTCSEMMERDYYTNSLFCAIRSYIKANKITEAEKLLQKLKAYAPVRWHSFTAEAEIEFAKGNNDKALEILAPALNTGVHESRLIAGKILISQQKFSEAAEHLKIALLSSIAPEPEMLYTYALALQKNGEQDEAEKICKKLIMWDGDNGFYSKQIPEIRK